MPKIDILGVKIDNVTMDEAVARVEGMLTDGRKHQIVTPNPEFVMLAQKDKEFRRILNEADLAIPDGIGLVWAGRLRERVTGTDLMIKICERAAKKGWTVFLLGGEQGVGVEAAKILRRNFHGLKIVGVSEADPEEDSFAAAGKTLNLPAGEAGVSADLTLRVKEAVVSDFLFVAYGAPIQEKWIAKNLSKIPVKVAMGVGGAFDFIVGKQKRAPVFVRKLGLEWFWRLVKQPWRARRQLALFKFVALVFWQKLKKMVK